MDRILELKSSTESIKRTMLMHEDIFKQQVKELHKLYNLQRKLMLDLKYEMSKIEDSRHKSMINNMSTWHHPRREIEFSSINVYGLANDQQRETSGSCSGENSKTILIPIRGLNNLEMTERSSTSNYEDEKMRNNNIHRCDEETNVELTLSIGPSNRKKRLKSHKEKEIRFSTSSKFEECGDATSSAYWFSQDLSLNRR